MKVKKMTHNTSLSDTKIQECCLQNQVLLVEADPQPNVPALSPEREEKTLPYHHREIF